ncbi:cation:dicarboxylase symporter family transporter [Pseudomonas sediminis]|uniref:cation:dicarboxylate symporter family transporter n=1 Tax=Pseudomonas TaxID=286 RepID=UPI000CB89F6C|nr:MULTISPECIES: cation:dicarboxylase symporter family transporter [Pseudomonas]MDG9760655.1 cation:dicarboxylase symporter family transporter [Pseudomonas sediminis]PKQ39059.1 sodium:dicarboxylate symporter [Pseudomonas sp. YY-1]
MIFRHSRTGIALLLLALVLGALLGVWWPDLAVEMKPLSDLFISAIGLCAPVVMFVLVCSSVAALSDYRATARLGLKAVGYWQLMSLLSLLTGLLVALLLHSGGGLHQMGSDWATIETTSGPFFSQLPGLLLDSLEQSFILKVLLVAVICGLLLGRSGAPGQRLTQRLDQAVKLVFRAMQVIVSFAPLAAFGAIAFIIGKYGLEAALPLAKFVVVAYVACLVYLLLVPAIALRLAGCRLWRLIGYVKEELLLVAATGSSVAALPRLIDKLEAAGCDSQTVRLTLTAGYSFNLNGSNLYLAVAVVFLAQLAHVELDVLQLGTILLVCLLTSLGSTSVAGSAFVTLTATLSVLNILPLESIGILIGVERLMKCRSVTNVLGNCVACVVIAHWDGKVDKQKLREMLG